MTKDEAIQLAMRIAQDFRRAGLPPAVMLADVYDDAPDQVECLNVFDSETGRHIGRVESEAGYERLLDQVQVVLEAVGIMDGVSPN
jgi:uncharacterized protein (DUF2267 family)